MQEKIPIGLGDEKKIFMGTEGEVMGTYLEKLAHEEIKGVYYFSKLLKLFFPDNYPALFRAGNEKDTHDSSFMAEYIELDEILKTLSAYEVEDYTATQQGTTERTYSREDRRRLQDTSDERIHDERVVALIKDFEKLGLEIDEYSSNFTFKSNGQVVFFDLPRPFAVEKNEVTLLFNNTKIAEAISELPEQQQLPAMVYLQRILELYTALKIKVSAAHPADV